MYSISMWEVAGCLQCQNDAVQKCLLSVLSGFRGVVTLYNKLNYPAEFTWAPNLGEKGTAFSIRPATG